ncbi:hemolymph lipopolysaccharide-binding protein [Nasonia vitripennis]|uniref:C-type lectin domain-containing protein n=1 Tax=Nasonia vitripennis TaxID=7425 RepID=A0A7M7H7U7_NASVI|nr:hemolymph lipopolysaccharide-binding protein [Nasonia vitripennis]XP_008203347.1 hemolymph lipopolysaccharide-binding protein [Nasonia vitripennis]
MLPKFLATLSLLLVVAASPMTTEQSTLMTSPSTELNLCPCVANSTSSPAHEHQSKMPNTLIHGMTCLCHAGPAHGSQMRDDYRYSPGIGAHKLHTRAASWNEARKMCNEEGGHLAIINSLTEATMLMDIFTKSGPVKGAPYLDLAYVGIHDLYKEGEWVTILGESLFKTGYTVWSDKWGGQPDNGGSSGNQNCGVFLKEGGLDDVNCDMPFAFFCELPMTYIIH